MGGGRGEGGGCCMFFAEPGAVATLPLQCWLDGWLDDWLAGGSEKRLCRQSATELKGTGSISSVDKAVHCYSEQTVAIKHGKCSNA